MHKLVIHTGMLPAYAAVTVAACAHGQLRCRCNTGLRNNYAVAFVSGLVCVAAAEEAMHQFHGMLLPAVLQPSLHSCPFRGFAPYWDPCSRGVVYEPWNLQDQDTNDV